MDRKTILSLGVLGSLIALAPSSKSNSKKLYSNPKLDIAEGTTTFVYRIQNSKGEGPYQPNNSLYSKGFQELGRQGVITRILDKPVAPFTNAHIALLDSMSRLGALKNDPNVFRLPPDKDKFDHSDNTFLRKSKPLTGFLNFDQFCRWFPFNEELEYLKSKGFNLYKVPASEVRFSDIQALFTPAGKGEIVDMDKLSSEEKAILKRTRKHYIDFLDEAFKDAENI